MTVEVDPLPSSGGVYNLIGFGWVAAISCDLFRIFRERTTGSENPRSAHPEWTLVSDLSRFGEHLIKGSYCQVGKGVLEGLNMTAHTVNLGLYGWGAWTASREINASENSASLRESQMLRESDAHVSQNFSYLNLLSHICTVAYSALGIAGVFGVVAANLPLMAFLFFISTVFYVLGLSYQTAHQNALEQSCYIELTALKG